VLDLRSTRVTDRGLEVLKALTRLETLELTDTRVSAAGVRDFRRAVPRVEVIR
jgi:hypothetical protein